MLVKSIEKSIRDLRDLTLIISIRNIVTNTVITNITLKIRSIVTINIKVVIKCLSSLSNDESTCTQ